MRNKRSFGLEADPLECRRPKTATGIGALLLKQPSHSISTDDVMQSDESDEQPKKGYFSIRKSVEPGSNVNREFSHILPPAVGGHRSGTNDKAQCPTIIEF
jgi:hypothetical protein